MCYSLVSSLAAEEALAVSMLMCGFTLFLGVCTTQWRLVLGVGLGVADAQLEVLAADGRCGAEQQKAEPDAGPQKLTRAPLSVCFPMAAHFPLGVCTAVKLGDGQWAGGMQMHSCRAEP